MAAKSQKNLWGLAHDSLLSQHLAARASEGERTAAVFVHLGNSAQVPSEWRASFASHEAALKQAVRSADVEGGVRMLVSPNASVENETDPRLRASVAVRIRDSVGASLGQLERMDVQFAHYDLDLPAESVADALLGLELALYRFKRVLKSETAKLKLHITHKGRALTPKQLEQGTALGRAMNLARHLVNLPPNFLNPVSYADAVAEHFAGLTSLKVEVWNEQRLAKENMRLHLGVGQGSSTPPRLLHLRYRPAGAASKAPLAFVGKGITFDTGGLDIKPSSGMRLMKKDMGGSASVLGLAYWAALTQPKCAMDFYLALAENSVSGNSFRPSDVITARNGLSVEIHNTDAEGRLVLADALDVAVTQKETPRAVIDVATLTGAIKVALGSHVAGLFSTHPKLAQGLQEQCQQVGDYAWVMPLVQKYRSSMNSPFADMVNAVDGFGGAVTAALFLEKFVKDVPWAHFDVYAWKDSAEGPFLESGGNGQCVAGLARWISKNLR